MSRRARVLVLGSSSWLGHYVHRYLPEWYPNVDVVGVYRSRKPYSCSGFRAIQVDGMDKAVEIIKEYRPNVLLNIARGEEEVDFQNHLELIAVASLTGCRYSYASSSNACDAQLTDSHLEDDAPGAQSDYGKFKARCETALKERAKDYVVFRFAATHGWAPNRVARTEEFLRKLVIGEPISVTKGILQNRTAVSDLAGMMVDTMMTDVQGVVNLGTVDSSEEVEFLRTLAQAFGYSQDLVVEADESKTNLVMVPSKIFDLFGEKWKRYQAQTIAFVSQQPVLQKYKSGAVNHGDAVGG